MTSRESLDTGSTGKNLSLKRAKGIHPTQMIKIENYQQHKIKKH